MIFVNERSTHRSGPDVPRRGMCSHAAGLNHNPANDAARPVGRAAFPLALGTCCSAARTERQLHAALHPSLPRALGCGTGPATAQPAFPQGVDQAMCQSLENSVCGCDSA